jgi:tetratricopeptide (TPR) repeat protein
MRRDAMLLLPGLTVMPGCAGEVTALVAVIFSMTFAAWLVGRDRQRRAMLEAEALRRAIATGRHREIEQHLRRELALAAAGEAVSVERQWLARAQLGGLLVAEWRLDEARALYSDQSARLSPHLHALEAFGRHEIACLSESVTPERLAEIRSDRDACLRHVPPPYQPTVAQAWSALEGLCLARMGRTREAAALLEYGLESLGYNPARVVYLFHLGEALEQLGERRLAAARYEQAMEAFPGTRLASEARARCLALGTGGREELFRRMLPESPTPALAVPRPERSH